MLVTSTLSSHSVTMTVLYMASTYNVSNCPVGEKLEREVVPRNVTDWIQVPIPVLPKSEVIAMIFFYVIIMVIALVGNLLIIYVITRRKGMKTHTNIYVLNLAASDLLVTLTCMWVHLGSNITPSWPFGAGVCSCHSFFQCK